jgi:hypothetical protein
VRGISMLAEKEKYSSILRPNNYKNIEAEYDQRYKFSYLHDIAVKNSKNIKNSKNKKYLSEHQTLDSVGIERVFTELAENPNLEFKDTLIEVIESILTEEVDQSIKQYFNSDYAIMFHSSRTIDGGSRESNPSTKWHCDAGPTNFMMVISYLLGEDEHGSSTLFLDKNATDKLKEVGYIYNGVVDRLESIDELIEIYDIKAESYRPELKAGETVVFAASQIAHRAEIPIPGSERITFDLCVIPSPVPWKEAIKSGYVPNSGCIHFSTEANRLLSALSDTKDIFNTEQNSEVLCLDQNGRIDSTPSLLKHLEIIFTDKQYASSISERLSTTNINFSTLTINSLLLFLKKSFKDDLDWEHGFTKANLSNVSDLLSFESKYSDSMTRFMLEGKPDPDAIMWPMPNHAKHPRSKFDMLPYVKQYKIMNKNTAIGSAGSCFAVEIAKVLQQEDFNYVISELGDNPAEEAIIDGYAVGSGKAMYSANFGILFNTPSLRQLAEKAFSEKKFNKYLVKDDNGYFMDPYRENVFFHNKENYLTDYPKHVAAIKDTLMSSEVFIFTAGLNECWELFDGTVISRNPRRGFHHMIQHKILTVQENIDNILTFFNIVKRHNPNFKLVLTLSPVPLLATGRGDTHHILEANTHSKAVLRVALEEVVSSHPDIYYLPSYELVTECQELAWEGDHRHVTPETVDRVITMFKKIFVEDS